MFLEPLSGSWVNPAAHALLAEVAVTLWRMLEWPLPEPEVVRAFAAGQQRGEE